VALEVTSREPVMAMADATQLAQVLSTVIAGAQRGSPQERTRVTIAWDVETVAHQPSPTVLIAGRYARITVRDDGPAVDATEAASVFDPVISKTGEGTGLALARAYSLVHEWGGDIAFSSEPGQGSTFTIYLPYVEPQSAPSASPAQPKPRRGETGTILVVDDETGIRELIRKILLRERYRVLEAGSAEEALALAQGQSIDLLITDVMLPGIHGPELARRMQQTTPKLKTLFISGYTGQEQVPAGGRFLAKPFTLGVLLEKVREALETK